MKTLRFFKEAADWHEAVPIGTGFIGGMIFGGAASERIQVNEDSVWSGGFMDRVNPDCYAGLEEIRRLLFEGHIQKAEQKAARSMYATYPHMRHYQTLGDVFIDFYDAKTSCHIVRDENGLPRLIRSNPELHDYRRTLDLNSAVGQVSYRQETIEKQREFFASAPHQVLVYRITGSKSGSVHFDLSLARKDPRSGRGSSFCDGTTAYDNRFILLHGHQGGTDGLDFAMGVLVTATGGCQYQSGSHIIVEGADEAIIYITGRTSYRSSNPADWCRKTTEAAASLSYEALKKEHREDYEQLFSKCSLTLNSASGLTQLSIPERLENIRKGGQDPELYALYFDFGRYLLIASSREGSLPANLQGIWNQDFEPAWGSKYTININIQMNYWMAEQTGLSTLHLPLLEHLKTMHKRGRRVAETMYHARGFCCHHNTDIWGDCAPQDNHTSCSIWPMGGAWLALHIFQHYLYTRDTGFLKEYFPVLKDAVLFFIDYMVQNPKGEWVTGPSASPENIYITPDGDIGSLCMGPSMDSQILRQLFSDYLSCLTILSLEDDIKEEVEKRLAGLPQNKIGKHGQIQEWNEDYEELDIGHRHISQLFALYPADQIRPDKDPALVQAAKSTLKRRLENGGGHTGWSKAWIINFYARLGDSQKAYLNLKELLAYSTLDNLFDNHPPFQIDGNFGGAAGILGLFVQDFDDTLLIMPALPEEFLEGELSGIRTKSGAVLTLSWKDGYLTCLSLKGTRKALCTVKIPGQALKSSIPYEALIEFEKHSHTKLRFT